MTEEPATRFWLASSHEPFLRSVGLSDAVAARGTMVFLGGQVGADAEGTIAEGLRDQTFQAMRNIQTLAEAAGASMADVTHLTILLDETTTNARREWWDILTAALQEFMPGTPPCATGYWVKQLASRRYLVEIQAIAVVPDARRG